jgi:hypothetical protein
MDGYDRFSSTAWSATMAVVKEANQPTPIQVTTTDSTDFPDSTEFAASTWHCACGLDVELSADLCPQCGRFRGEALEGSETSEVTSPVIRSPRKYARTPLVLAAVVLAGMVVFFQRPEERPWEEMPVYTARPSGPPVHVLKEFDPRKTIAGAIRFELNRFELIQKHPRKRETGQAKLDWRVRLTPVHKAATLSMARSQPAYALESDSWRLEFDRMPEDFARWEEVLTLLLQALDAKAVRLPESLARSILRLGPRSFRLGESFSAGYDTAQGQAFFPGSTELGSWRGWMGYTVASVGRLNVGFNLEGGFRSEDPRLIPEERGEKEARGGPGNRPRPGGGFSPFMPFAGIKLPAAIVLKPLLEPFGTIHTIRARFKGNVRARVDDGFPVRFAAVLSFEIKGVRQDRPYTVVGDLVINTRYQGLRATD